MSNFFAINKHSSLFSPSVSDEDNFVLNLIHLVYVLKISLLLTISQRVCQWQAFPAKSKVMLEPTLDVILSSVPLQGRLLPLLIKIRSGWKGLPGTNTLAYLVSSSVTKKKVL